MLLQTDETARVVLVFSGGGPSYRAGARYVPPSDARIVQQYRVAA